MKCYKCKNTFGNIVNVKIIEKYNKQNYLLNKKDSIINKNCKIHVWNNNKICKHCNIHFSSKTTLCYHKQKKIYSNANICIIL